MKWWIKQLLREEKEGAKKNFFQKEKWEERPDTRENRKDKARRLEV